MAEAVRVRPKSKKKTKVKKPKDVLPSDTKAPVPSVSQSSGARHYEDEKGSKEPTMDANIQDSNKYSDLENSVISDKESDSNKESSELEQSNDEQTVSTPIENAKDRGSEHLDKSVCDSLFVSAYEEPPDGTTLQHCEQEPPEEISATIETTHVSPALMQDELYADAESSSAAEVSGIAHVDLIPSAEKTDLSSPEDISSAEPSGSPTMGGEASHERVEGDGSEQPDLVTSSHSNQSMLESATGTLLNLDQLCVEEPSAPSSQQEEFTVVDSEPQDAVLDDVRPSSFTEPLKTVLGETTEATLPLYPVLTTINTRCKPLTGEQLKSLYFNPELEKLDQVVNDFLENIHETKHEFYEIVLNYYRARNHLVNAEQDVESLRADCVRYSDLVWITQDKSVKVMGKCADGYNVNTEHTFEVTAYDEQAQNDLSRILKTLRSFVHEELSLYAYSAQLSKLQVESYLHELYMSCPAFLDIPDHSPVTAYPPGQRSPELQLQVNRLKTCVKILFQFQRKPSRDSVFVRDAQAWLRRLVASLLRVATTDDHIFLLNHVLRCPAGIASWCVDFVQVAEPPCAVGQMTWGHPLLDHTVAMLATLMKPAMGREDLLYQFRAAMTPMSKYTAENPWILVDSDGEEDEDDLNNWQYLMENDLVALLDQLPLSPLFRHVLYVDPDNSPGESYTAEHTSESGMLKLFAFASCLIRILGCGLENFCQGRYRQLNKRLARLVKEVLEYVSEHWENMQSTCQDLPPEMRTRLQMEYDQTFCRAVVTILAAPRLGSWQFLANLPYRGVSEEMMWQLLWLMHHGCKTGSGGDVQQMPHALCKELLKDPDGRKQFEEKLVKMATSEAIYLLTTFANMACSRTEMAADLVEAITSEIYELAYLSSHTREFCSKIGRELLATIAQVHAFTIGIVLTTVQHTISSVGMVSLYLFRELPVSLWQPTEDELSILSGWLLEREVSSPESQLARLILEKLNWGHNAQGTALFLDIHTQRHMAVILVEAYIKHLANKNVASYLTEGMKQMASVVRNQLTWEQQLSNWAWEMALRLSLHSSTHTHPLPATANTGIIHPSIPDINESPQLYPIIRALQNSNPLAAYLALVMSKYGHGTADFCSEGLLLLGRLIEQHHYVSAVRVLSYIMPLFYQCPQYLSQNNRFIQHLQALMYSDQVRKSMSILSWEFPGPITKLITAMIQASVQKAAQEQVGGVNGATVISFWLNKMSKLSRWQQDRNILYVVDSLVKAGMQTAEGNEVVLTFFRDEYQSLLSGPREQGMISSLVSWISTGNNLPSLMEQPSCAEFPWFAYQVLLSETEYEAESRLWPTLQQELFDHPEYSVEQALKKTSLKLHVSETLNAQRLCIYRWANQAIDMALDHPLLPLVWQRFFLLYLGRLLQKPGLPERGSVSEKFFESMTNVSLMKRMKRRLDEAADFHHKTSVDCDKPATPDSDHSDDEVAVLQVTSQPSRKVAFHQELVKLYQTLAFWLDEPRLHDPNLYLPALPQQYMANRLLAIFQNQHEPWLEYVCVSELELELTQVAGEWHQHCQQGLPANETQPKTEPTTTATERLLSRLRQDTPRRPPPSLVVPNAPVEEVNHTILHDKKSLLYALRGDIQALIDFARLFSLRVSKHVAIDCTFLELLPNLYKNDISETVLSIPCQSTFNPTHRCKGPAAVTIRFEEKTRSEIMGRKADENRAEYKQLMIESLLPPPQTVCSAAVHVENVITALIRLVKSTPSNSLRANLMQVGTSMFYYLSSYVSEDTKYYPPTRQFFSSCIEILGQEFIHNNPTQSQPLLQCILKTPSLVGLLAPNFSPNATSELFVNMYEDMINVPTNQGVDVAFTLLTKFDVKQWLESSKPPLSERSALVEVIGNALCVCGTDPDSKFRLVFEVYRSHLRHLLLHCFPDHYGDVLKLILKDSASGLLSVDVWTDFLKVLGCAPEPPKEVKESMTASSQAGMAAMDGLVQPPISHMRETMDWLSQYFFRLRVCSPDSASFGLYPHWQPYVASLVSFFGYLTRNIIQHTASLARTGDLPAQQSMEDLWKQISEMFAPWVQPLDNNGQILSPWIQSDCDVATAMMNVFVDSLRELQAQYEGILHLPTRNVLGLLWPYYGTMLSKRGVPECVLSIYHSELVSLPWSHFCPDTYAIDLMKQVQMYNSRSCFLFLAEVFCNMNWPFVLDQCGNHDALTAVHQGVFELLVKMAKEKDIIENTDLPRLLTLAETFNWHFLDSTSYEMVANWFLDNCDCRCVLAEHTARNAQALGLLKASSGFVWKEGILLHIETPRKRCCYVRCLVQLLCRCSHLSDVDPGDFATYVNNMLTEIETVVGTIPDANLQSQEALSLCGEALHVLNNAKPSSPALDTIIRTMLDWIDDSPSSLLLRPLVSAAGRTLAAMTHMALLVEALIQAHFTTEGELGELEGWGWVLSAVQVPELNQDEFLEACLHNGSYLTLFTFTLQRLPLCRSLDDELPHLKRLVNWTVKAKPRREDEGKLFLWWAKVVELLLRQLHYGGDIKNIMVALNDFVPALFALAEDKASAGFLGSLGLGRRSQLTHRFRLIARVLATFLLAQIPTGSALRTEPHSPGAPGVSSPQGMGPSSYTLQALMQLEALKHNKHYSAMAGFITYAIEFTHAAKHSIRDSPELILHLVRELFPEKRYLSILHATKIPTQR